MTEVNFLTDEFFTQFGHEHELVVTKEKHIASLREELNPEQPKLLRTALLAVVVVKLGLDKMKKGKKRDAAVNQFKDAIQSSGVKPALTKLLSENAQKFAKHEAFRKEVSQGVHEGVEWYTQIIADVLDAEDIATQSKLIEFLNPKEELSDEVQIALLTLKLAGVKKSDIQIKNNKVTVKLRGEAASDERLESIRVIRKAQKTAHNAQKLLDLENCQPSK